MFFGFTLSSFSSLSPPLLFFLFLFLLLLILLLRISAGVNPPSDPKVRGTNQPAINTSASPSTAFSSSSVPLWSSAPYSQTVCSHTITAFQGLQFKILLFLRAFRWFW
ncbi:hypothetical protein E2C01_086081 [Portunus trituberculatus]|uniref:Uncharacterized protein n=1 Tax=Portunus trituberculatus TaxID=210409 RepID=A0A5B7JDN4_PORTR|nr:hypothetical protein [Portunus trituberculatus]